MNLGYEYLPTDLDDELFLSDVPLEVIQNSIKSQFDDPFEFRKKDYVQSFLMKYEFSKENLLDDDVILLDICRDKFLSFMEKIFYDYLSVGFTNIDDLPEEDQHDLIHLTYRFFIKNIKKNFVNVIYNYIKECRQEIQDTNERKKDVTSLNFKLEIDDEYDILVLSNLGDIIDYVLNKLKDLNDVNTFLDLCVDDEPILELEYVKKAYVDIELTGNFIEKYIDMIDDEFLSEIQSKIRNKILKKYPKRVRQSEDLYTDDLYDESEDL